MWHVEQQATMILSAMLCKNLYSTWTHYWGAFMVAAKLKLESFSWTTLLIDDGIFFVTNHISALISRCTKFIRCDYCELFEQNIVSLAAG